MAITISAWIVSFCLQALWAAEDSYFNPTDDCICHTADSLPSLRIPALGAYAAETATDVLLTHRADNSLGRYTGSVDLTAAQQLRSYADAVGKRACRRPDYFPKVHFETHIAQQISVPQTQNQSMGTRDLLSAYAGAVKQSNQFLSKTSTSQFFARTPQAVMMAVNKDNLAGRPISLSEAKTLSAFSQYITPGANLVALESQIKQQFSNQEKLAMAQMLDSAGFADYDTDCESGVKNAKQCALTREQIMANYYNNKLYGTAKKAGYCLTISSSTGQFLRNVGFPQTFAIQWSNLSELHDTTLAQDPKDPLTHYALEGGALRVIKNREGADAMYTGDHDASLSYMVSDPGGATHARISSQLGMAVKLMIGASLDNPMEHASSDIIHGGVHFGDPKVGSDVGAGFATNFDQGWQTGGVTSKQTFAEGRYTDTSFGTYTGYLNKTLTAASLVTDAKNPTDNRPNQLGISYFRLEQNGRTPCLYMADKRICGRIEGQVVAADGLYLALNGDPQYQYKVTADSFYTGWKNALVFDFVSTDKKYKDTLWMGCTAILGFGDMRDRSSWVPTIDNCSAINTNDVKLSGEVTLLAGSVLLYNPGLKGTVLQSQVGLADRRIAGSIGYEGRLNGDTPTLLPGAIRKLTANTSLHAHGVDFMLSILQDLEAAQGTKPATQVHGTLNVPISK